MGVRSGASVRDVGLLRDALAGCHGRLARPRCGVANWWRASALEPGVFAGCRGAALAPFGQTAFYGMRIVGLQPVDLAGRGGRGWGCGAGLAFGTWGCSVTPQREVMAVWGVRGVG